MKDDPKSAVPSDTPVTLPNRRPKSCGEIEV